jgi:Tfp pilus assembly protein PilF
MKNEWRVLAAVCVVVVGVYAYAAYSGFMATPDQQAADAHYNQLVEGFQAGQLSLKKEVPPGLTRLADPYDPDAGEPYRFGPDRLHDLSYYKGRLYLYHGVTPALILFWPFVALTGEYLFPTQAVMIFCAIGFLASVALLRAVWRRYFSEVSVGVVAACALALGLATVVPVILPQSDVYEVAISCGYMLTMLSLGAIWCALHETERRCWWLAAASATYGLAVGARPSLLFGAIILLVPVAQTWYERRRIGVSLLAATGPIILIGLGLMLYNLLRFNNPLEFGEHYQLAGERQVTRQLFSLRYLWFNFRVYFLEPAHWSSRFPFVHDITVPPLPVGHARVEHPFGVLTSIPLVWVALAVPLAWRGRSDQAASTLRWFATATALLFGICALTIGLFWSAIIRYEVDFLPALVLLAVIGILSLERALADKPVRRRAARCGWGLMLGFSVAFNLLVSVEYCAEAHFNLAYLLLRRRGQPQEEIKQYEQALRFNPDYAEAHLNLGVALEKLGRDADAIRHYKEVLRLRPDNAEVHINFGNALLTQGKGPEAMAHYEEALRINPDYAEAHSNLGAIYQRMGKLPEAIAQYEQALRSKPDYVEAHFNLGLALEKLGRTAEAMEHYEQALKLRPDFAPARNALTRLQAGQ